MLKVGLIVDSEEVPQYVHDLVTWSRESAGIEISHLIVQALPPRGSPLPYYFRRLKQRGPLALVGAQTFRWLTALEGRLLARNPLHRGHLRSHDIGPLVPGRLEVQAVQSPSGYVHRFSESDVAAIAALKLDLLIRCGSGILRGEVLSASRLGIISFHHADNRINRGGPAGFWELYLKQAETGVTIQRLTEELDGGDVLVRGTYPTKHYYLLNQAFVYLRGNALMKKLLEAVAQTGRLPEPESPLTYCHPLYRLPGLRVQLGYALSMLTRLGVMMGKRMLGVPHEKWQVAYVRGPWRSAVLWRAQTLRNQPGCFLADPFALEHEGKDYIFAEEYSYRDRIGRIAVYSVDENRSVRIGLALSEDFHLSFPYLFRHQGQLYMCPETSAINEIRLYRCVDFPLRWEHCATLMKNVSAADTLLFEREGRWWLLTNIDSSGLGDHASELHVFTADSPLSSAWQPLASNPVIVSAQTARNGGVILEAAGTYRVGQRQGFCVYGESATVHRIDHLGGDEYKEVAVLDIALYMDGQRKDCHHFHSNTRITVFDYK